MLNLIPPHRAMMRIAIAAAGAMMILSSRPAAAQVRINLKAWREPVLLDTLRQDHRLHAAPDKVYQAVLQVYADLGIPTGNTDGKSGIIGSEKFEHAGSLAGAQMAKWFDCGESTAGPNANTFRLEIAIVTWVQPDGTGTNLGIATVASGRDVSGVFRNPKECSSTGALELKILDRIQALVGK